MNTKSLAILGGVFTLLLMAAFYPQISAIIHPVETEAPLAGAPNLTGFNAENVNQVEFLTPAQTITLSKNEDSWLVDGKKADPAEVDAFFEALQSAKIKEIAGENAENHTGFGVAATGSATLTINGENSFILGNSGYQPDSFYLRGKDDAKVYLAGGELRNKATQTSDFWRDKEILNVDVTKIVSFNVENDSLKYSVTKSATAATTLPPETELTPSPEASAAPADSPVWTLTSGDKKVNVPAETAKIMEQAFSPLKASGFLSAEELKTFDEKQEGKWTITALDAAGAALGKITVMEENQLLQGKADGFEDAFKMPVFELDVFLTDLPEIINPPKTESSTAE